MGLSDQAKYLIEAEAEETTHHVDTLHDRLAEKGYGSVAIMNVLTGLASGGYFNRTRDGG